MVKKYILYRSIYRGKKVYILQKSTNILNILKTLKETNPELTSKYKENSLKYLMKDRSQSGGRIDDRYL